MPFWSAFSGRAEPTVVSAARAVRRRSAGRSRVTELSVPTGTGTESAGSSPAALRRSSSSTVAAWSRRNRAPASSGPAGRLRRVPLALRGRSTTAPPSSPWSRPASSGGRTSASVSVMRKMVAGGGARASAPRRGKALAPGRVGEVAADGGEDVLGAPRQGGREPAGVEGAAGGAEQRAGGLAARWWRPLAQPVGEDHPVARAGEVEVVDDLPPREAAERVLALEQPLAGELEDGAEEQPGHEQRADRRRDHRPADAEAGDEEGDAGRLGEHGEGEHQDRRAPGAEDHPAAGDHQAVGIGPADALGHRRVIVWRCQIRSPPPASAPSSRSSSGR